MKKETVKYSSFINVKYNVVFSIIIMAMSALQILQAQNYYFGYTSGSYVSHRGEIRMVDATHAISYYEENGQGYFAYLEHSTIYNEVPFIAGYKVKDFQIVNGYVIFCGWNGNMAIIGNFAVSELSSTPPQQVNYKMEHLSEFRVLNRIAVTYKNSKYIVAATGVLLNTFANPDTYGGNGYIFSSDYQVGLQTSPFAKVVSSAEAFWDVVVTENYFSVISATMSTYDILNIYSWPIDIAYTDLGNYQTPHRFTLSYAALSGKNRVIALEHDNIALATLYCHEADYATHVYVFQVHNTNYIEMLNAQCIPLVSKTDPTEMAYLKGPQMLVLAEQFPYITQLIGSDGQPWDYLELLPTCIHLYPYKQNNYTVEMYQPTDCVDSLYTVTAIDDETYAAMGSKWMITNITNCNQIKKWWLCTHYSHISAANPYINYHNTMVTILPTVLPVNSTITTLTTQTLSSLIFNNRTSTINSMSSSVVW